ncbi:ABC transporter ATP-binding protein [Thermoactinomyces mirandus]|uniref:ABC transporter ATP-binding protein n=1 Tax=Thermoactinomyces mirandus TaxID=2756294 RepID=A0A7W1XT35_9BACL|nr:ABC transporter ATP-binding protein [Thermoactinomyces mirandus]MBA4602686.1 ABC transporter ATP-binding protein [Thermoactinomyces mirandus]
MAIVKTRHLTKRFGKFVALNGVNIEVNKGEIYGFIGPNGAGKSTTLRILLGMLKATTGEARIFGKDAWKDAVDIHKRVAYVPGDVNLWPNLTGGEVIDVLLRMRGEVNKNRRNELIEKFRFDPAKKCRTYSKGNRQKVALIAAFASNADLYILDEPTSGLDPLMERIFEECVIQAKNEGKSILLSSHILSEVEKLCDTIGIIREGKMIETGRLSDMRHLTRTNFIIRTKKPVPSLKDVKGIHNVRETGPELAFQADPDQIDEIIRYISQFGVVKLESTPLTLEDLFMRHYQEINHSGQMEDS